MVDALHRRASNSGGAPKITELAESSSAGMERSSIRASLSSADQEKVSTSDLDRRHSAASAETGPTKGHDPHSMGLLQRLGCMSSTRVMVLLILCLQNSMFTVLRRYSQGVLRENYSKHEVLLVGEVIKIAFSSWMIQGGLSSDKSLQSHLAYLVSTSGKMFALALIYGAMNILSFVSLRNIGAGLFTIFAQCKILTTATFSAIILQRKYSWTKWRALIALMFGVLLFSEPIWSKSENLASSNANADPFIGTMAVLIEVTLSGFASIYFEKVIKTDPLELNIWERNFQLALGSFPVYLLFIIADGGGTAGFGGGWSPVAWVLAMLGAAGGLLVALSIKYGDSILKTLATTGAIILSSVLDKVFLGGPLTPTMMIAGVQVVLAIINYTFDATPPDTSTKELEPPRKMGKDSERDGEEADPEEQIALVRQDASK